MDDDSIVDCHILASQEPNTHETNLLKSAINLLLANGMPMTTLELNYFDGGEDERQNGIKYVLIWKQKKIEF